MSSQRLIPFNLFFFQVLHSTVAHFFFLQSCFLYIFLLWSAGAPIPVYMTNALKFPGICNRLLFFDIFQIKLFFISFYIYVLIHFYLSPVYMTNAFKFPGTCNFLIYFKLNCFFISFHICVVINFYLPLCTNCILLYTFKK
jgi:hypothetical protein